MLLQLVVQLYDLSFGFLYFQPRSQRNIVQQLVLLQFLLQLQHEQREEKGSSAAATAAATEGADGCLVAEEVLSIAASYCSS